MSMLFCRRSQLPLVGGGRRRIAASSIGSGGRCLCYIGRKSSSSSVHKPAHHKTISRASHLFRTSQLTSQELCQHSYNLATFGENSLHLNAYTKVLPLHEIIHQAKQADERIQNGTSKSLLDGIPVTIKANIAVGKYWELPNACSTILTQGENSSSVAEEYISAQSSSNNNVDTVYESDIARRLLKDCGAVLIGITNMDEFGMGSLGTNNGQNGRHQSQPGQRRYSPTYNPIPWMQRISTLIDTQLCHGNKKDDNDYYWLQQIQNSNSDNPHGVPNEDLNNLLDEVQYWVCNSNSSKQEKHSYNRDESPLLSSGGSSSGAAVATAHGSSLLSIGTDTGGSIRLPAAWTSTVGFKPSYGTWSRYGVVSYASSLDTVGFIAGTTECAEIAWRCLNDENNNVGTNTTSIDGWNGQLCRDATARVYHHNNGNNKAGNLADKKSTASSTNTEDVTKSLTNIRVGIPNAFSLKELPPEIADAWSESAYNLQNNGGATLVSIPESKLSSEWIKLALASYYVLACAEASSNLSRYDGVRYGMDFDFVGAQYHDDDDLDFSPLADMTRLEQQISATRAFGFGEEVQRRVIGGTSVLSSDRFHTHYEAAAVVRAKLSQSFESLFRTSSSNDADRNDKVDVMLVPTALSFPSRLNAPSEDMQEMDPTEAFANDIMTIPISLGGLPSISIPASNGRNNKRIGMQIFASRGSEDLVLRVAKTLHKEDQ